MICSLVKRLKRLTEHNEFLIILCKFTNHFLGILYSINNVHHKRNQKRLKNDLEIVGKSTDKGTIKQSYFEKDNHTLESFLI